MKAVSKSPLILIGIVLMLFFGGLSVLLQSGLLTTVSAADSNTLLHKLSDYGFLISLFVIALGFALGFVQEWKRHDSPRYIAKLVNILLHRDQAALDMKDKQIEALTEALTALSKTNAPPQVIDEAFAALEKGDSSKAQAIFKKISEEKLAEGKAALKEAATAARHQGALAFQENTQEALQAYRRVVELEPESVEDWNRLGILLERIGELSEAEQAFQQVLKLAIEQENKVFEAKSYRNLGNIYETQGDLKRAKQLNEQSLTIYKEMNDKAGIADSYNQLGVIYREQGELKQAKQLHKQSLAIYEKLENKKGLAANYGNLGNIYKIQGDLNRGIQMYEKSLAIEKELGSRSGIAANYQNLGGVYYIQGDLDRAKDMCEQSLAIYEQLGQKKWIAHVCDTLGSVYQNRGGFHLAGQMYEKSLCIHKKLGAKEGMAVVYLNWGNMYRIRGDLKQAEQMYQQCLAIFEELDHKDHITDAYYNLGLIYEKRGDLANASIYYQKSLDLYEYLGSTKAKDIKIKLQHLEAALMVQTGKISPLKMGAMDFKIVTEAPNPLKGAKQ
ncbi:MAG: tetratricopeptide repeat protein [Thiotrichaceae bacterium]|nr:tetratricopeptide repeat protein [Thiotrichaceae bacterium]